MRLSYYNVKNFDFIVKFTFSFSNFERVQYILCYKSGGRNGTKDVNVRRENISLVLGRAATRFWAVWVYGRNGGLRYELYIKFLSPCWSRTLILYFGGSPLSKFTFLYKIIIILICKSFIESRFSTMYGFQYRFFQHKRLVTGNFSYNSKSRLQRKKIKKPDKSKFTILECCIYHSSCRDRQTTISDYHMKPVDWRSSH